jgi:ankyrin repeat protein
LNKEKRFDWQFKKDSFSLHPSQNNQNDWRQHCSWNKTPLLLKAWVRGDIKKLHYDIEDPREIYVLNLLVPEIAGQAMDKMISKEWVHLKSIVPQIIGKTLPTNDRFARRGIYTIMPVNQGNVGGNYHPEFDWKTYLRNFKEVDPKKALSLAAENGFWHIVQHYDVDMNFEINTHFEAAWNVHLPIVKWIVEQKPEALEPATSENMHMQERSLIRIALYKQHFEMLDYFLSKIKSPLTYKIGKDTLIKLLLDATCDTTMYLQKYWDLGLRIDIDDIIRGPEPKPHLQNQLWMINKMAELKIYFDKPEHFDNQNHFHEEALISAYQKGLISKDQKGHLGENVLHKAIESGFVSFARFLMDEQKFDIHTRDNAGNSVLHYAAKSGSLVIIEELLAKGSDPQVLNNMKESPLHSLFECYSSVDSILEITKLFLTENMDLNQPDHNNIRPFEKLLSMPNMSFDMIRELIKLGGQLPPNALHVICRSYGSENIMEMIRFLVDECGHDVNGQDQDGQTPLHKVTSMLNTQAVDFLLSKGAQVDVKDALGQKALHHLFSPRAFFYKGDDEKLDDWNDENENEENNEDENVSLTTFERQKYILEKLLKLGVQIDEKDAKGRTAFLLAMTHILTNSNGELFELLCSKGADPKVKDDEGSGIDHYFFENQSCSFNPYQKYNIIPVLTQLNIDCNARNAKGETPLFVAFRNNNFNLGEASIKALLELGADINALDNDGNSIFARIQIYSLADPKMRFLLKEMLAKTSNNVRQNTLLTLFKQSLSFKVPNSSGEGRLCENLLLWLKSMMDNQDVKQLGVFFDKAVSNLDEKDLAFIFGKLGLDINAIDDDGSTILHKIVSTCHGDQKLSLIQKYVEKYNADVTIPDEDGKTLLEKTYEKDFALYLISKGADVKLAAEYQRKAWGIE